MIQVGDIVQVIDEPLQGKVIAIKNNQYSIITEEEMVIKFSLEELVKVSEGEIKVNYNDLKSALAQKEVKKRKNTLVKTKKNKNQGGIEIDLHIEKLIGNKKNMTNYDILTYQLETARRELEFALERNIPKIIFIHGVGDGVLKTELEYLFGRYDRVYYNDAPYYKYGSGATEVNIRQKK